MNDTKYPYCPIHKRSNFSEVSNEKGYYFLCNICDYKYILEMNTHDDAIEFRGIPPISIYYEPVDSFKPQEGELKYKVNNIEPDSSIESC